MSIAKDNEQPCLSNVDLLTFAGDGLQEGININSNAHIRDVMDSQSAIQSCIHPPAVGNFSDPMKFNNRLNRCIHHEGEEIWISRSVTVLPSLFFVKGDRTYVPLGLRGDGLPDEVGKWALPGGYLDYDETTDEAVIRETWEELGLNLIELQQKFRTEGSLDQPYYVMSKPRHRQNVSLRYTLMFFLDETDSLPKLDPQVPASEVVEARWFELNEALSMPLAFYHAENMRHCLETIYADIWPGVLPTRPN